MTPAEIALLAAVAVLTDDGLAYVLLGLGLAAESI